MNNRAERAGFRADAKRKSLSYQQIATHRKGRFSMTADQRQQLEQEQAAYRNQFKR